MILVAGPLVAQILEQHEKFTSKEYLGEEEKKVAGGTLAVLLLVLLLVSLLYLHGLVLVCRCIGSKGYSTAGAMGLFFLYSFFFPLSYLVVLLSCKK